MALELGIALSFFVAAALFVFVNLSVGSLVRPDNPSPDKNETYECGERPTGNAWIQFNPRFYVVALMFVLFDVELAFVYPIASVFRERLHNGQGTVAAIELALFMILLWLGLAYVWQKGDLESFVTGAKNER